MESATIFTDELLRIFEENNIPESNLINAKGKPEQEGKPRSKHHLEISPDIDTESDFGKFLKEKYPNNPLYIQAFDKDWEKETRKEMDAEGPEEMAERVMDFLAVQKRYSEWFHKRQPDSRLIIFNFSHYDTISPLVKKEITNEPIENGRYLPVELGAGISITIDKNKEAKAWVNGKEFDINLNRKIKSK